MCGITGIINFRKNVKNQEPILRQMIKTLVHRGPNEQNIYTDNNVLLGHDRLIVIDPNGGIQPMKKIIHNNEYTIVYNGELYNTEDIRSDLKNKGYCFNSYSDTEVILTSFIEYGIECVKMFNGIFAFSIYDKNNKIVYIARDQMGVKPLFYTQIDDTFLFASEIKALFKYPNIKPVIDKNGLTELFSIGPAISPGSGLYKNINELAPSHYGIIKDNKITLKRYWHLEAKEFHESLDECIFNTRNLLTDAIKRQLVSDVPVCTFLSGGLDSSIISYVASEVFKEKNKILTTYSIDYSDNDKYFKSSLYQPTSDNYWAQEMANILNTNHIKVELEQQDLYNALKDAVIGRDMPGMVDIDSSLFLFCKEVRKDFVVALSGECADEIFAGYPWFTRKEFINLNTFPWSNSLSSRKTILNDSLKNLPLEEFAALKYKETIDEVPHLPNETKEEYRMRELFYLNLRWFMVTLLNRKDRMSMASSLEVRVPFADIRLVEYAFNIPREIKLLKGREKGLLRKAFEGLLPDDIIYRKKSPYPKTYNPKYTDLVCEGMNKILMNKSSPILELIDYNIVKEIIDTRGKSYPIPWYGQLMTGPQLLAYLIQINIWLEKYNVEIIKN